MLQKRSTPARTLPVPVTFDGQTQKTAATKPINEVDNKGPGCEACKGTIHFCPLLQFTYNGGAILCTEVWMIHVDKCQPASGGAVYR
eukprot:202526-Chlamydomonas_euryale.AAC.1